MMSFKIREKTVHMFTLNEVSSSWNTFPITNVPSMTSQQPSGTRKNSLTRSSYIHGSILGQEKDCHITTVSD